MTDYVLDCSALVTLVHKEPGWQNVAPVLRVSTISAVNFAETVQCLRRAGMPMEAIQPMLLQLVPEPIPFDATQAYVSASIHEQTRQYGLSFGDCACLSLALTRSATALTAERIWDKLKLDIRIKRIRSAMQLPIAPHQALTVKNASAELPAIVRHQGPAAEYAWGEFFFAHLRNVHTRSAYMHAVKRFLAWVDGQQISLERITPGMIGGYFDQHPGSPATRKLHLAAIRGLMNTLVNRHVLVLNPANSVRGERYQVIEGKTPEISIDQARRLLGSIALDSAIGMHDRAIIAILIYTAARAGAVAKLRLKHFTYDGTQWALRFEEKGGKSREIPARHDLQNFILDYIEAAHLKDAPGDAFLFRSGIRRTGRLTEKPITGIDICRLIKRRLKAAGLPARFSPHSFRVTTVTDLLTQGVPLEDVQHLAGHADPRTTRLYDRRQKRVTRNIVERISI